MSNNVPKEKKTLTAVPYSFSKTFAPAINGKEFETMQLAPSVGKWKRIREDKSKCVPAVLH